MKISDFPEILRPNWISGIQDCESRNIDMKQWIFDAKSYTISTRSNNEDFELLVSNVDSIKQVFAFEISRMSIASFETLSNIKENEKMRKSQAWNIIKYYYAAFFSAHALIRSMGVSCSYFDPRDFDKLNELRDIVFPSSAKINKGSYKIIFNEKSKILRFEKKDGAAHETLWKTYLEVMTELKDKTKKSSYISKSIVDKSNLVISEIIKGLTKSGNNSGNWLSMIRNSVNYRFEHLIWFPFSNQPRYYTNILRDCDRWIEDPYNLSVWPDNSRVLQSFVEICSIMISINRENLNEMHFRSLNKTRSVISKNLTLFCRNSSITLSR